jgi:hypothetical protein
MKRPIMMLTSLLMAVLMVAAVMVVLTQIALAADGSAPYPFRASATVDGDSSEWSVGTTPDLFDHMYLAGDVSKAALSDLYLRYDCNNERLYALVVVTSGYTLNVATAGEHFIRIDTGGGSKKVDDTDSPPDGTPPDFAFLSGSDSNAPGWEAVFTLTKDSVYSIEVHTLVDEIGGAVADTSATTADLNLDTSCPTAITLASFEVQTEHGRATVTWETGTEIDNAGFNLYRARARDGPWLRINAELIAAGGDPVSGASYSYVDRPGRGTFYYRLEDVDLYGATALHEPVFANLGPMIRLPWFRPLWSWPEF